MVTAKNSTRELIREFFQYYPDYELCRALAENIKQNVTTYPKALEVLARKARAEEQNRRQIEEKLANRALFMEGRWVPLKDLSLRQLMDWPDDVLKQALEFYFKHPYAHGRTKKTRLLPRSIRTIFLSALLGHAKRRGIDLDYESYFEILKLL